MHVYFEMSLLEGINTRTLNSINDHIQHPPASSGREGRMHDQTPVRLESHHWGPGLR